MVKESGVWFGALSDEPKTSVRIRHMSAFQAVNQAFPYHRHLKSSSPQMLRQYKEIIDSTTWHCLRISYSGK